jgi:hypothetical protein
MNESWTLWRIAIPAGVLAGTLLTILPAQAAEHAFALDAQRYGVAEGRNVRTATAVGVLAGRGGDASLALAWLDDSFDGTGIAVSLGGAAALSPAFSLRAGVTRIERNAALDAWSARVGPEFHAGPTTLDLAGFQSRRSDGVITRGGAIDVERTVSPRVVARISGSFARTQAQPDASAAAIGTRWNAVGPLHLMGEIGIARDPAGSLSGGGGNPGGVLGSLVPGQGAGETTGDDRAHLTGRMGIRLVLP